MATPRSSSPRAFEPAAFTATVAVAVGIWAADVVAVAVGPLAPPPEAQLRAAAAALFLTLLVGGAAGAVVGLVHGATFGGRPAGRVLREIGGRWLRGDAEAHRRRVAGILGGAGLAVLFGAASFVGSREIILRMARPHFMALAILGLHAALIVGCVALFPAARAAGGALARGLGRVPGARWIVATTGRAAAALGGVALTGGVAFAVAFREPLGFLPWPAIGRAVLGAVAGLLARAGVRRIAGRWRAGRRPAAWRAFLPTTVGLAVSAPFAFALGPDAAVVGDVLREDTLLPRAALAALHPLLDVDGDGRVSLFGGGDCAPRDPAVHAGAVEIPDNGIDEDCNGADLAAAGGDRPWGIWGYPVPETVPERPPVILITVDALAARHMGFFGYERDTTPRMDAFAARSVVFLRAFAQGPSTRLSFPSLFTSRWDSEVRQRLEGRHPFPLEDENVMLAEIMRAAGYHTAAVLPAPFFTEKAWEGLLQGFEQVEASAAKRYHKEKHNHTGAEVTAHALRVLRAERDDPLFLWVHYFDNHYPHVQPEEGPKYGEERVDVYDAELRMVDGHVGRLLDAVQARFGGRALVILTSDHGYGFDAPRHVKAGYGYDLHTVTLHVPLIFQAPFLKPRRVDGLASTMDIVPTLVDLLRIEGRFAFQGVSLVPALLGKKHTRLGYVFHQFFLYEKAWKKKDPLLAVSVRTPRYNLMLDRRTGRARLYDWNADYLEKRDLSRKKPDVKRELESVLSSYLSALRPAVARGEPRRPGRSP